MNYNLEKSSEEEYRNNNVEFVGLKLPPISADMDDLFEALIKFQDESRKLSTHQEDVTIRIKTKNPIILTFLADLHIGAIGTRYRELRETVELLGKTKDCYVGSVGDTIDNYIPGTHNEGMFAEIIPPEVQKRLVEYLYDNLRGKLLFLVGGCHDEWSHDVDDFDWTKYLQEKFQCFNLGFGGFVNLVVGRQTYRILAYHKFRPSNSMNLTYVAKRAREILGDADISIIAHNHQPAIERTTLMDGKDRVFIRPGSFKRPDRYARSLGFGDTGIEMPNVILFPNERKMIPALNLGDAITVLEALRGK